jgi:hypothetical protein
MAEGSDGIYITDDDMEYKDDMLPYLTYHKKSDIRPGHIGAEFEIQLDSNIKPNVTIKIHMPGNPDMPVQIEKIIIANTTLTQLSVFVKPTAASKFTPLVAGTKVLEHAKIAGTKVEFDVGFKYVTELMLVAEEGGEYDESYIFNLDIIGCRSLLSKY